MSLVRRVLGLGYPLCPRVMFLVTLSLGGKGILTQLKKKKKKCQPHFVLYPFLSPPGLGSEQRH